MSSLLRRCYTCHTCSLWIQIWALFLPEKQRRAFRKTILRKTTKNTVKQHSDVVRSVVTNHHGCGGKFHGCNNISIQKIHSASEVMMHRRLRPRQQAHLSWWPHLVSALAVFRLTMQPIRHIRGVSLHTTTQWRHLLQQYPHAFIWPVMCKYDVIDNPPST